MLPRPVRALRLFLLLLILGALACDLSDVSGLFSGGANKPNVSITSPPSGSQFQEGQDVAVQSISTDAKGIVRVELIVDGTPVRTDTAPSPQDKFTLVQTWKATQGTHTLSVRAYNTANVASDPAAISVTVTPSIALAATPTSTDTPTSTPTQNLTVVPAAPPTCPGPPVIGSFTASPNPITSGSSTSLSWGLVSNATSAAIDHGIGGVATPGSKKVSPTTTTTYTLTATGCGGVATSQVTVTVNPAPTATVSSATTTQVSKQVFVPANNSGSATATCPSGSIVTGGGYDSETNLSTQVYEQFKSGNSWVVSLNNSAGTSYSVNALAICLSGTSGTTTQITAQTSVPSQSADLATANCPGGSVVTGGGFAMSPGLSNSIYGQFKQLKNSGNGWEALLSNATAFSRLVIAYAICLSGTSATTTQIRAQASVPANSVGSATANCPGGTVVTGGGFATQPFLSPKVYTQGKSGNGWEVFVYNPLSAAWEVDAFAICASF